MMEHAVLAYIAKINLLGMVFNIFVLFLLVSVIMESVKQMMDVVMVWQRIFFCFKGKTCSGPKLLTKI